MSRPEDILSFWFGEDLQNPIPYSAQWWKKDLNFDHEIKTRFEGDLIAAASGKLNSWKAEAKSCLAFVVLLDQFSRNIYRDTPKAFAQDPMALQAALEAIQKKFDQEIPLIPRTFFYMPLMHSEDRDMQRRCVEIFSALAMKSPPGLKGMLQNNCDYAKQHAAIVERFERFPHRNEILGRTSTAEEIKFLKQPGSAF